MKGYLFRAGLLAIVLAIIEGTSFAAVQVLLAKRYLSSRPTPNEKMPTYDHYLRVRHPVLGRPLSEGRDAPGGAYRDETGARRLPAFPDPHAPSCISVYGDSFAESVQLDAEHAWSNLVAQRVGCRISNYAQAGCGSDQALLRHRLNKQDDAPIVIFAHMHENLRRNLTRIRDLVLGVRQYDFKPRFVVDARGNLQLVPLLELSEEEYERAIGLRDPLLKLDHELFQPGGPMVAPFPSFPYTVSLIRAFGDYRVQARLRGNQPPYAAFYQPGNTSKGYDLMIAMAHAFREETTARGQRGIWLFLPPPEVVSYHLERGVWIHQALLDAFDREGIAYMDFGPFLEAHSKDPVGEAYLPGGHYSERGDALLADFVSTELEGRFAPVRVRTAAVPDAGRGFAARPEESAGAAASE